MPKVIRVGDKLSHGGTVLEGSPITTDGGKPISRVGDKCVCSNHGTTTIVQGSDIFTDEGKKVALAGHKTSCGATLLPGPAITDCAS